MAGRAMASCRECGKPYWPKDLAPLVRRPDGTTEPACYKCVAAYIRDAFLWAVNPFWRRRAGREFDAAGGQA